MKPYSVFCAVALTANVCHAQQCPTPEQAYRSDRSVIPLCLVTAKVKETLDKYNSDPQTSADLPKLSRAEFGFQTTRSTVVGFSLNLLVFNIGVSRQLDTTDEVAFVYVRSDTKGVSPHIATQDFLANLLALLQNSAKQVSAAKNFGELRFSALTLNLSFGLTWDLQAGVNAPVVALVTPGAKVDKKRADIQTVKLAFEDK